MGAGRRPRRCRSGPRDRGRGGASHRAGRRSAGAWDLLQDRATRADRGGTGVAGLRRPRPGFAGRPAARGHRRDPAWRPWGASRPGRAHQRAGRPGRAQFRTGGRSGPLRRRYRPGSRRSTASHPSCGSLPQRAGARPVPPAAYSPPGPMPITTTSTSRSCSVMSPPRRIASACQVMTGGECQPWRAGWVSERPAIPPTRTGQSDEE